METLQIKTGQISLRILDDNDNERGVFKFNPEDILAAQRFFELQAFVEQTAPQFQKRYDCCEDNLEKAKMLVEFIDEIEVRIDQCFGEGSSSVLFGNQKTLGMWTSFFEGITPYYKRASEERMSKYKKTTPKVVK